MRPRWLLTAAFSFLLATNASAGPIRATFTGDIPGGNKTVDLLLPTDIASVGAKFTLGETSVPESGSTEPRDFQVRVSGLLTFGPKGGVDLPAIWIHGGMDGTAVNRDGIGGSDGSWEGTTTTMLTLNPATPRRVEPADFERWERDLGIPPSLLNQLLTPGALTLSGSLYGGRQNRLPIVLNIAPAPVPEPASWAAWLLVGAGAWTWRRRNRKSNRLPVRSAPPARASCTTTA